MSNSKHNPLPAHKHFTTVGNLSEAARATSIPFARPVQSLTRVELFSESNRLAVLLVNLNEVIDALVATSVKDDLLMAADIQAYKLQQEAKLVAIQAQIIATAQ